MNAPAVSVVMGVHNGARHLSAAMDGILAQRGVALEFIVVDDGSTDDTPRLLTEYAARDGRVRVLARPREGLTRALIAGCAAASGPFIARQDADDVSLPGRLAAQYRRLADDASLALVSCWAQWVGPEGEPMEIVAYTEDAEVATRQLQHERIGPPAHGSVMFRRDAYARAGGYRPEFYYAQDSDLWLRLGMLGRLTYVPQVLYQPSRRVGSISVGRARLQARFGELGQLCHRARLAGKPEEPFLREARELCARATALPGAGRNRRAEANGNYFIGASLVRRGDPRARTYLWRAVRVWPLHARAWLRLALAAGRARHGSAAGETIA